MSAFSTILDQMLFLFLCMLVGFTLNRTRILPPDADVVISRLENYAFVPALVINSFRTYCTAANLGGNAGALGGSVVCVAIYIAFGLVLAPRFARNDGEVGIYRYAIAVTNFGFMGNSLVQALMGDEALFRYLIMTLPANVFAFSAGIIWMTAGKKRFSPRMLVNPLFLSMLIGMVLGLTRCPLPGFLTKALDGCAACFSPLAMVLTGYVVGKYDIPGLFKRKPVYVLCALRLVILPLLCLAVCKLLKVPGDITSLLVIFSAMPLGLNTIVFPAAYGGDETLGASMAVISNLVGLATVPLVLSLVL